MITMMRDFIGISAATVVARQSTRAAVAVHVLIDALDSALSVKCELYLSAITQ